VTKVPVDGQWIGRDLVLDVLRLMENAADAGFYGPYVVVMAPAWRRVLKEPYLIGKDGKTPVLGEDMKAVSIAKRIRSIREGTALCFSDLLTGWEIKVAQIIGIVGMSE
jgi:hypothetical protein